MTLKVRVLATLERIQWLGQSTRHPSGDADSAYLWCGCCSVYGFSCVISVLLITAVVIQWVFTNKVSEGWVSGMVWSRDAWCHWDYGLVCQWFSQLCFPPQNSLSQDVDAAQWHTGCLACRNPWLLSPAPERSVFSRDVRMSFGSFLFPTWGRGEYFYLH